MITPIAHNAREIAYLLRARTTTDAEAVDLLRQALDVAKSEGIGEGLQRASEVTTQVFAKARA